MKQRPNGYGLRIGITMATLIAGGVAMHPSVAAARQAAEALPPARSAGGPSVDTHARLLLDIAREYEKYTIANPVPQWAIALCRGIAPSDYPGSVSQSEDERTHGKKLYMLWVKDFSSYMASSGVVSKSAEPAPEGGARPSPIGQTLVKETFRTQSVSGTVDPHDHGVVMDGGHPVRKGAPDDLFIMTKLDPKAPETDEGWVYGIVSADRSTVVESGRIQTCMRCHDGTTRDHLYGPESTWPLDEIGRPRPPVRTPVAPTYTERGWAAGPSLRHARAAHAVAATRDAIYTFAGTGDGSPVLEVERFDGAEWIDESRLPGEGLNAPAAAVIGDAIYLIGGFGTVTNRPTAEVHIYQTKERKWSKAADLPAPRGGHAAAVLGGLIHVIGGGNSQSTLPDHSVFDPEANRWIARAPLPHAEGSPAAVVVGDKLYAIGGRSGSRDFGDVMVYSAASDSWSAGPAIEPRATCGAVAVAGSMYLFGGESQARSSVLPDVFKLREGDTAWMPLPSMPTARSFARAVVFKGAVYVIGGSPEPQSSHAPRGTDVVERLEFGARD